MSYPAPSRNADLSEADELLDGSTSAARASKAERQTWRWQELWWAVERGGIYAADLNLLLDDAAAENAAIKSELRTLDPDPAVTFESISERAAAFLEALAAAPRAAAATAMERAIIASYMIRGIAEAAEYASQAPIRIESDQKVMADRARRAALPSRPGTITVYQPRKRRKKAALPKARAS
jgi:hypothetical protein